MGTNYYIHNKQVDGYCSHCGRGEEKLHIGKSSCGWKFLFEAHEGKFTNYKEFKEYVRNPANGILRDEYGDIMQVSHLLEHIEYKQTAHRIVGEEELPNIDHTEYIKEYHPDIAAGQYYSDEEGYNFCTWEFS